MGVFIPSAEYKELLTAKEGRTELTNQVKEYRETIDILIAAQGSDIEGYKERLSAIHQSRYRSDPQAAGEWAATYIAKEPLLVDKMREREKELVENSRRYRVLIPLLFEYVLTFFDERIEALRRYTPEIVLQKKSLGSIFQMRSEQLVRTVTFKNGSQIQVKATPGKINDYGFIDPSRYPQLKIFEATDPGRGRRRESIDLLHKRVSGFGGGWINYLSFGDKNSLIDDKLREELDSRLTRVISKVRNR